jgi:hypothetical protein
LYTNTAIKYKNTDASLPLSSFVNDNLPDYDWRAGCDDDDFEPDGSPKKTLETSLPDSPAGGGVDGSIGGSSRLIKTNPDKTVESSKSGVLPVLLGTDRHGNPTYVYSNIPGAETDGGFVGDPNRWDKYAELGSALAFKKYINDHLDTSLVIAGHNSKTGEKQSFRNNKINRWCKSYVDARLAQLYKLRTWKNEHPELPSNMWTLTVPHDYNKWGQKVRDGCNHFEVWENIRQGWRRLRDCSVMRGKSFVKFYEPHKTGYPHIHLMCFDDYSPADIEHIKELWSAFTGADLLDGAKYDPGKNPKSLVAYLMKYLTKQNWHHIVEWTDSDWLFNSIAHKYKYRLFSASTDLSKIMQLDKPDDPSDFVWETVKLEGLVDRFEDDPINVSLLHRSGSMPAITGGKLLSEYPDTVRKKYLPVPVESWGKIYGREIHDKFCKPSLDEF